MPAPIYMPQPRGNPGSDQIYQSLLQFAMQANRTKEIENQRQFHVEQQAQARRDAIDARDKDRSWDIKKLELQGKIQNLGQAPESVDKAKQLNDAGVTMANGSMYLPKEQSVERKLETFIDVKSGQIKTFDLNHDTVPEGFAPIKPQDVQEQQNFSRLHALAKNNPNAAYAAGYRMTDKGEVYLDAVTGKPEKLKSFADVMGKRGTIKDVKLLGELRDDAIELKTLLLDPEVKAVFGSVQGKTPDFFTATGSFMKNKFNKWLAENHIAPNSKAATAMRRMQMLSSDKRKQFLGTAITPTELQSALAWLPDAADSYDAMLNKMNVFEKESKEGFKRYLDMYKDIGNMSPLYKAFGMERFGSNNTTEENLAPTTPGNNVYNSNDPLGIL